MITALLLIGVIAAIEAVLFAWVRFLTRRPVGVRTPWRTRLTFAGLLGAAAQGLIVTVMLVFPFQIAARARLFRFEGIAWLVAVGGVLAGGAPKRWILVFASVLLTTGAFFLVPAP